VVRVALITGAGGGIGAATAQALAARGFQVVLTYRSKAAEAETLAAELGGVAYPLELGDSDQIRQLADRLEREHGGVDVLVHNAGLIRDSLFAFLAEKDWDEIVDVNLKGPVLLTRALVRGMLKKRWGRVISVASLSGVVGQVGQAHYSAAKGGLIAFTKVLARELASYGVTANTVAPGFIDTPMLAPLPEKKLREYIEEIPVKRLGRPEEVAALIAFLASDDAAYITGQTWRIDGGLVMA
jgi:3-oxoacyl-[acyl-carrier protein] reductase